MTWQPNDALMTRAMEAFWDAPEGGNTAGVRAALIACRDDMVAEAVRAERDAVDKHISNVIGQTLESGKAITAAIRDIKLALVEYTRSRK